MQAEHEEDGSVQSDQFRHLYDKMPSQRVRTFLNIPKIWFKDLSDRKVAIDALSLLVKSLPGVIATFSFILAIFVGFSYRSSISIFQQYQTISVSVFLIVFSVSIVFAINLYLNRRLMKRLSMIDHHRQFRVRQFIFLTNVKSNSEVDYAYRFIIKAKEDFVESFPAIFSWTGNGEITLHPRNKLYTLRPSGKVAGGARRIDIVFEQPMRKNEERVVEYTIRTISCGDNCALPHMGIAVVNKKYPAFNTFMIVVFSDAFRAISIYRDYYFGGYSAGRLKNVTVDLDENFTHSWDLRFRVNWAYCVRWEL